MDVVDANLYEEDQDFFSSFFDTAKDDFSSNQIVYPNLKLSANAIDLENSCSPLREDSSKIGREGGNPEEDEGFEGMSNVSFTMLLFIKILVFFLVRLCRRGDYRRFAER